MLARYKSVLKTSGFSTGLLINGKCCVQWFCGYGYNLDCSLWWSQKCRASDPPSLSHYSCFRRRRPRKRWESWHTLRRQPPWIWERRTSSSEVCMDKGICKSWTVRSPGSAKVQAKKEIYNVCVQFTCWSLCVDRCSAGLDSSFTLTGSAKVQAKKEHSIMAIACWMHLRS